MSDAATELDLEAAKYIESQHPEAPWFCWSNMPAHAGFIVNIGGQKRSLPYLCYQEVRGKTFQYSTEGQERPVWSREVHLAPTEQPEVIWLPDDNVGYFIRDPTFNFVINQVIDVIDDPGLVAEVACFRYLSTQMPAVLECSNILKRLL